ncbi:MAG: hypothetical protein JWO59_1749 [Chloroflexi bacterium]|nr:hypothetical protein [Chloroflexota bacterium]
MYIDIVCSTAYNFRSTGEPVEGLPYRAANDQRIGDSMEPAAAQRRSIEGAGEMIRREVLSWPGVTTAPHRFGGVEFLLGKRELGHLHGDRLADLPFPVRVREELVRDGRALSHHVLPESGWVSYPIHDDASIEGAISLFRLAYDRAVASRGLPENDDTELEKQ